MQLKLMIPQGIVFDSEVDKVIAEASNGFFCLKPKHIDFTAALVPGILYAYDETTEFVFAIDEGILVKCGEEVLVSVIDAIKGDDLQWLESQVKGIYKNREKTEETARLALQNLEANLIRQFVEFEKSFEGSI